MTDYSKIDFGKCELPEWLGKGMMTVESSANGSGIYVRSEELGLVACRIKNREWLFHTREQWVSSPAIRDLESICSQVDSFITAELARIAEAELPPWRECSLEEALANPDVSEWKILTGAVRGVWKPMEIRQGHGAPSTYRYRTRAPKLNTGIWWEL